MYVTYFVWRDYFRADLPQVVMTATAGLMAGTQIFRQDDSAELYPMGLLAMIFLVLGGLVLTALQEFIYLVHNRRLKRRSGPEESKIL